MNLIKLTIFILTFLLSIQVSGQNIYDTLPFICHDQNILHFAINDEPTKNLKERFQNINLPGSKKINILHIGDSHLQAAFLTEEIRQNLFQHYFPEDTMTEPGFIFPYTLANTNNPYYYKVGYTGNWEKNKNTNDTLSFKLGLSGITVATDDTAASFWIKMQNSKYDFPAKYYFNKIKIYHSVNVGTTVKVNGLYAHTDKNYSSLDLQNPCDSIFVELTNPDTTQALELYGLMLGNDKNKLGYHTIGVNGATAQSYLKCELLSPHLKEINPDLVILSLGTNETFNENFSSLENELILKDLIYQIRITVPKSVIILTIPGDHMKNEVTNPNINIYRESLLQLKKELNIGIWDFYSIMGGENAILLWNNSNFTANDKIHLNRSGYQLQGQLFVKAFLHFFDDKKLKN